MHIHIFKKRSRKIAFFLQNGLFSEISDIAFEILKAKKWNKEKFNKLSKNYNPQEIEECLKEIETLREKGFFNPKKLNQRTSDKKKIINRQPSGIVLDVAQVCNLNCKYCYGSDGSYGSNIPFMSKKVAKAAINYLIEKSKGVKKYQIVFFGGEPFLNFSLIKYTVNFCKRIEEREQKKFQFSVTTNATILNNKIINFLKDNKFGVMVSFDGIKRIHDKYRPFKDGKGSFDLVVQNTKKISKHLPLNGRCTVVNEMVSKNNINEIIKNSILIGIKNLILSPVDCSKIDNAYYSLSENNLQKLHNLFEDITEKNFINLIKGTRAKIIFDPYYYLIKDFYEGKIYRRYRCGAFFGMRTVSTNGNIYPCHRFVGLDNFIIGNVFKGMKYSKITKLLEDLDRIRYKKCKGCWLNKICGGPCYYYIANIDGTFNSPPKTFCDTSKKNYESAMYFMVKYYSEIYEEPNIYIRATQHL